MSNKTPKSTTFVQVAKLGGNSPYANQYFWSTAANWTNGVPVPGDTVTIGVLGYDDIVGLSLNALTVNGSSMALLAPTLDVGTLTVSSTSTVAALGTMTVSGVSGAGATFSAQGATGALIFLGATDPGEAYQMYDGAVIDVAATPAATSSFAFIGIDTLILRQPKAVNSFALNNLSAHDVIELPGASLVGVSIGGTSLTVTTDAASYVFNNVTYNALVPPGATAVHDAVTGLERITFNGTDAFTSVATAASGPNAGLFLWSNTNNWSLGPPVNGDGVTTGSYGTDDIANLSLVSLTAAAASALTVQSVALSVGTLTSATNAQIVVDGSPAAAAASLTVGSITGSQSGQHFTASRNATITIQSSVDPGATYVAQNGGTLVLSVAPSSQSMLNYSGQGEIALKNPGATIAASLFGITAGDVLELPGAAVVSVAIGQSTLSVTTTTGTYNFTNVTYATPVLGYTASHDAATGLEAITFTTTDTFQQAAKANAGPYAGQYLWSNPSNWSSGVPLNGTAVATGVAGLDDLANLSLTKLTEAAGGSVTVVGGALTVDTVSAGPGAQLLALGAAGSAPAFVSVNNLAVAGGLFGALGTQATFVDVGATDPGATYVAQAGGTVALNAAPHHASLLQFNGAGRFELLHPGATNQFSPVAAGDVIEIPGSMVSASSLTASGLAVTTDAVSTTLSTVTAGVTGVSTAHDAASGLESLSFTDQAVAGDFNGDHTADQLWQAANGLILDYGMGNGAITAAAGVGVLDATYRFLGTGDFNGDGTADQLWQAANGTIIAYAMKNAAITGASTVGALDPSYRFLAAADFNGDGTTDMLWQAAGGVLVDYTMSNGAIASGAVVGALDPTYKFLAAADFNGDGTADQLWQAANGTVIDYGMTNGTITSANVVGSFGSNMHFLAAADYNGDGRADMLWQSSSGALVDYTMNGPSILSTTTIGSLDGTWTFLKAGDFNGDGTADLLWQNAAGGGLYDFTMQNGAITGGALVGTLGAGYKFLG